MPHYLAKSLVGLPTRLLQIIHDGALASLVVVSSGRRENVERSEHADVNQKSDWIYTAKVGRPRARLFLACFDEITALGSFSIFAREKKLLKFRICDSKDKSCFLAVEQSFAVCINAYTTKFKVIPSFEA